jgi:hypothetical protein
MGPSVPDTEAMSTSAAVSSAGSLCRSSGVALVGAGIDTPGTVPSFPCEGP